MARRADNDGKKQPAWRTRMDKMQRENRCVTCGVDKDLTALWRTLDDEAKKDVIEFIAQEIESAKIAAEKKAEKEVEAEEQTEEEQEEAVEKVGEAVGDGLDGRVGEEAEADEPTTIAEAAVAMTKVAEETPKDRKNRLRREARRAAAKKTA